MSKKHDIKWTRKKIIEALRGQVSETCVIKRDNQWLLQGKYCLLTPFDDGTWDLWICNPADMNAGLSQQAVNYRVRKLRKIPQTRDFVILNREAHTNLPGLDEIISDPDLLRLLGIRRKKQLSAAQKKVLLERLAIRRRAKAA